MIELDQILEGLIQRTADGKLRWSRTVESDQFVASLARIHRMDTDGRREDSGRGVRELQAR